MRHSIGRDDNGHMAYGAKSEYRNYFCTGKDCSNYADIQALVAAGLMRFSHRINAGRDEIYFVTDAGREAALEDVVQPKLTRSQRRYREFQDADCGMKFGEWLRGEPSRRRYRNGIRLEMEMV
jgi:hypothetical protein